MAVKFTIMDLYTNTYYPSCYDSCYNRDVVSIEGKKLKFWVNLYGW